jgi:hypothetical protein
MKTWQRGGIMQQWEYLVRFIYWDRTIDGWRKALGAPGNQTAPYPEVFLDEIGAEGWDLVGLVPGCDADGRVTCLVASFRKPIPTLATADMDTPLPKSVLEEAMTVPPPEQTLRR